jgi:hypothetical protein
MVTQIRAHEKRAPLIFVRRTGHRAARQRVFRTARETVMDRLALVGAVPAVR